ncbi:MAG TPA: hypothetical protein VFY99_01840 [Solirubrobacterales bacterium]
MNLLVMGLIVAGAATAGIGVMYAVRRRANVDEFLTDTTRGSAIFGVIGTAFAVLLAFVMFVAFESFNEARDAAEAEAAEVKNLFHSASFLPAEDRDELQGELNCYGRAVVHQEWEAMRSGDDAPGVELWIDEFEGTLRGIHPESITEQNGYRQLFVEDAAREEARRERTLESEAVVSAPVWFIIGLAGLATVGFVVLFTDRREAFFVQASMIAGVAGLVTASLLLVWFLDHPYQDAAGSIEPVEMERTIADMEREAPGVTPPCAKDGEPI